MLPNLLVCVSVVNGLNTNSNYSSKPNYVHVFFKTNRHCYVIHLLNGPHSYYTNFGGSYLKLVACLGTIGLRYMCFHSSRWDGTLEDQNISYANLSLFVA